MSEHFTAARADLQWEANTGKATADIRELDAVYRHTTGAMSDDALRLSVAQDRLNRAIKRSGAESTAAKSATLAYRRELASLTSSSTQAAHAATRHTSELQQEERAVGRLSRGVLAGSGALRGLGRSVAFASSGFLGGAGLAYAVESTIRAAENSQKVLGQTANAVTRAGLSWTQYGHTIRAAALEESKVSGFDDERLLSSFSKFVRQTKDVNEALRLNALAANVARGADIELEQAAKIVARAHEGQARGLVNIGVAARKGATGIELINAITQKYANSAKDYGDKAAGAQDRFRVALENTQEVVAEEYLPSLARTLNRGADWLNQSKNQQRIQRDVADGVHAVEGALQAVRHAYDLANPEIRLFIRLLGGAKGAAEFLLAVYAGAKIRRALLALGLLKTGTLAVGRAAVVAEGETVAAMAGITAAETTAAAGATGTAGAMALVLARARAIGALGTVTLAFRFPGLAAGLAGLASVPALVTAAAAAGPLLSSGAAPNVPRFADDRRTQAVVSLASSGKIPQDVLKQIAGLYGIKGNAYNEPAGKVFKDNPAFVQALYEWAQAHGLTGTPAGGAAAEAGVKARHGVNVPLPVPPRATRTPKVTPLDRLSRINLAVASASAAVARGDKGAQQKLVAALKDEIDFDRHYEDVQRRLITTDSKHAKQHASELARLYADEQSAQGQITSIEQGNAQKAKEQADKAARAREKAHRAREAAERKRERDYRAALALRELRLRNAVKEAGLTKDTLADDRVALAHLIAFDKAQEHNRRLTAKERESYHARELAAQKQLADLTKKKKKGSVGSFESFAEAAVNEFRTYGSNISDVHGVLSAQDERARAAETLLKQIRDELHAQTRHAGKTASATGTIAKRSHRPIDDARYAAIHGW